MSHSTLHHRHREAFSQQFLDRICPMPQPMRSLGDWQRAHHRDLDALTDQELGRELRRAQHRADFEKNKSIRLWLETRISVLAAEQGRRRDAIYNDLRRLNGGRR